MSKDAIARVRAAAAELAFKPSEIARALSSMSAGLVGIYVPDFHGAFFGPFLQTISHELRHCNRRMVVANGFGEGNPREQTLAGIEFLIERECDGILVFSNHLLDEDFGPIHAKQPRLAVVNRRVPAIEENCFYVDHHLGGALAAEALLAKGHRRFAVIAGPDSALDNLWRLDGFFAVLAEAGIARDEVRVVVSDFSFEGGWQAGTTLLDSKQPLTALFCANDEMAMGALEAIKAAGRVSKITMIGCDAIDPAKEEIKKGNLAATIAEPPFFLGKAAVSTALKVAKGEKVEKSVILPSNLVTKDNVNTIKTKE